MSWPVAGFTASSMYGSQCRRSGRGRWRVRPIGTGGGTLRAAHPPPMTSGPEAVPSPTEEGGGYMMHSAVYHVAPRLGRWTVEEEGSHPAATCAEKATAVRLGQEL